MEDEVRPNRLRLYSEIMRVFYPAYLRKFPRTKFVELLYGRYGVPECRLMTVEQVRDLRNFMAEALKKESA